MDEDAAYPLRYTYWHQHLHLDMLESTGHLSLLVNIQWLVIGWWFLRSFLIYFYICIFMTPKSEAFKSCFHLKLEFYSCQIHRCDERLCGGGVSCNKHRLTLSCVVRCAHVWVDCSKAWLAAAVWRGLRWSESWARFNISPWQTIATAGPQCLLTKINGKHYDSHWLTHGQSERRGRKHVVNTLELI